MLNANTYVTEDKGIGGTIRNRWEDFYVEEIPEMLPDGEGPNIWIWIEKLGRSTLDVLLDISRDLHISRKRTGFAGMKDKNAITRQWICISNMESEEQFKEVEALAGAIKNTEFLEITRGRKKLRMGQLKGNKFRILIKDVEGMENFDTPLEAYDDAAKRAEKILKKLEKTGVPNYFGWQRFGKPRTTTHLVGEALVRNDLGEAVGRYIGHPSPEEGEDSQKARQAYDDGDLEKSLELMHGGMRYEKMMIRELIKEQNKAARRLAEERGVHAYQSYLFNAVVSERVAMGMDKYIEGDILIDKEEHIVRDKTPEEFQEMVSSFAVNQTAPLFGTKVPFAGGKVGEMEEEILTSYDLTRDDFECPKMPKLGSHGLRRAIRFQVWDASAEACENGVWCEFSIDKGSYATSVLREVMKVDVI